jgi:hypothetical protein
MGFGEFGRLPAFVSQAFAAAAMMAIVTATPARAQSADRATAMVVEATHARAADVESRDAQAPVVARPPAWPVHGSEDGAPRRPSLLLPLYGSFALLQAMDAHSTVRAVRGGAVERNPLLAPVGDSPAALFALKAATTAGTIVLAERLWRRHPVGAVLVMVAVNGAYAAIVASNYRR